MNQLLLAASEYDDIGWPGAIVLCVGAICVTLIVVTFIIRNA